MVREGWGKKWTAMAGEGTRGVDRDGGGGKGRGCDCRGGGGVAGYRGFRIRVFNAEAEGIFGINRVVVRIKVKP
ncbi:hypothetical protein Acr_00g0088640 [Actinidia rufa]|uniref:Uncharacterized protein n=1 Tax=Actinidia rufa TaxID=165716 RepID=A0A7J0DY97_9ERIC|nr:hypothetical protein Acr_00g0088640 [Actinidia rufa]